jgi:hypothetical protein
LLHYWESAPNPTEDCKYSKKFACGGQFSILFSKLNGFDHSYIAGKCSKSDRRSQIFKKNRLRRAAQYTFLKIKWVRPFLYCWKSAPNSTEDHKSSKKIACGGQLSIFSSKLNGLDHSLILLEKCSKFNEKSQIEKN